jgi:hypothetical protein
MTGIAMIKKPLILAGAACWSLAFLVEVSRVSPGLAVLYMALFDGLLLVTVGSIAMRMFLGQRVHGSLDGPVKLITSLIIIFLSIIALFLAFALLLMLVGLLMAIPFGTIAYFAAFANFGRDQAAAVLSIILALKLAGSGLVAFGDTGLLKDKGMIVMVLLSLLCNLIISFLHSVVPRFLVTITDTIAAIVVAILALIAAIPYLLAGLGSLVRLIKSVADTPELID